MAKTLLFVIAWVAARYAERIDRKRGSRFRTWDEQWRMDAWLRLSQHARNTANQYYPKQADPYPAAWWEDGVKKLHGDLR